jgi:hypothetical protein
MSKNWTLEAWHQHCRNHGWRAKGPRKNQGGIFSNVVDFINSGGMQQIEYVAAAEAAEEAKQFEREVWLPRLEGWLAAWLAKHGEGTIADIYTGQLRKEIKRLRRVLKIHKGSEEERAAVRERVRKSRQRTQAKWNYQGSIHYRPPDKGPTEVKPLEPQQTGYWRPTAAPGAVAAAYKLMLQRGQEPTPEAIAEFFKGIPFREGPVEVAVPLMLANLHSRGELNRIRAEVKGE